MDARTREETRRQIAARRSKPAKPQRIHFPADGIGQCVELEPGRPLELCIETTDRDGRVVPWLTDEWWIEVQSVCRHRSVNVAIMPTPGALFDEVVLHQLQMVRRIAPRWSLIGYAAAEEVVKEPDVERWLDLPFDEVRLYQDPAASQNGAAITAQSLVTKASHLEKNSSHRQARMRIIHSLPSSIGAAAAAPRQTAEAPSQPSPVDRLADQNTVEST